MVKKGQKIKRGQQRKAQAQKPTRAKMLKAIKGSHGIMTRVAEELNCDWTSARKWIKELELMEVFEAEREQLVDKAENKMDEQIDSDDEKIAHASSKFILQTLGRSRGYGDKVEIEHSGNVSNYSEMSDEELMEHLKKINKTLNKITGIK